MSHWNIDQIVSDLRHARHDWREAQQRPIEFGGRELPSKQNIQKLLDELCAILFPMRLGPADLRQENEDLYIGQVLSTILDQLYALVLQTIQYQQQILQRQQKVVTVNSTDQLQKQSIKIVQQFASQLASIRRLLDSDSEAAYSGDPAAQSVDEVLLCYPGMKAMIYHRIAHALNQLKVYLLARMIAEIAHDETGIDIHPGATIGKYFFIDHGTGVVIGETCIIGDHVRIYQAVTLGAKRFEVDNNGQLQKNYLRHPIVEDNVVIYAGATILGRITIGQGSVIGGNVWLTHSIPANSQLTQQSSSQENTANTSV